MCVADEYFLVFLMQLVEYVEKTIEVIKVKKDVSAIYQINRPAFLLSFIFNCL